MKTKIAHLLILLILSSIIIGAKASSQNRINDTRKLDLSIAHLYGYARYFNPNKSLNNLNWDKFLMHTLRQAKDVPNNDASIRLFLENTFRPLIPDMKLTKDEALAYKRIRSGAKHNKGFVFEHYGFGSQKRFTGKDEFHSKIIHDEYKTGMPKIDSIYTYRILENLYLHYPIAISKQNRAFDKELRKIIKTTDTVDIRITENSILKTIIKKELGYSPLTHQDNSFFKANLISQWAIMKHFYPYRTEDGLTDDKMDILLLKYMDIVEKEIPNYADNTDESKRFEDYFYILKEFMGNFNDGHISNNGVYMGESKFVAKQIYEESPLIALDLVQGDIVSRFDVEGKQLSNEKVDTIKRGDKLVSINNIPIDSLLSIKLKYISSPNDVTKKIQFLKDVTLTRKKDSLFNFVFESQKGDKIEFSNKIENRSWGRVLKTYIKKDKIIDNLGNGAYYINLSSTDLNEKVFEEFVITNSDSINTIIFDLREYPMPIAFDLLAHLSPEPLKWGDYRLPIRYFPNQENEIWKSDNEEIQPKQPILNDVKFYTLINADTFSFGESMANVFRKNKLGILVGTNTSGCNGDMSHNGFKNFGSILTIGKDFDGYHSTGISPDIYIEQSIEDFKKGKDTVLEYVKELIK